MKSLKAQLASYSAYHQDPRNKLLHFFGVPLVTLSLLLFLSWFRLIHSSWPISAALLFFLGVTVYYLILDLQVGALTLLAFAPLLILSHFLAETSTKVSVICFFTFFVGGWIIQLWGHYLEGRRPALTDNLFQVFNAPLFLVCEILFKFQKRKDLKTSE